MHRDSQHYLVILEGYEAFIPFREVFRVKNKRQARRLKARLLKRRDITHKRIYITPDGIAKEIRENYMFRGFV